MIDHQTTILHHFYACPGQNSGYFVVTDAKLHPNRLWFLCQQIVEVRRNILRAPKDVHHIDFVRNLLQLPMDLFAEDLRSVRIVNRDGNDPEPGVLHVLRNVKGGLTGLCFGFDSKDRNAFRF